MRDWADKLTVDDYNGFLTDDQMKRARVSHGSEDGTLMEWDVYE